MSWKTELRKAGYDPKKVTDATKVLDLDVVEVCDIKSAVIGSPTACSGARLILRKEKKATFAWVGAHNAIVAFGPERILRYRHNGNIPKKQDQGFTRLECR